MKEKIKDTIVDLLLDGVKEKLDSVKENYKWQKLFVSTGDFFVNNPDVLVKFEDDLYSVFSKDNLIRIAKRLKDKNGYDFSQLLHNELYDLMVSYEKEICCKSFGVVIFLCGNTASPADGKPSVRASGNRLCEFTHVMFCPSHKPLASRYHVRHQCL